MSVAALRVAVLGAGTVGREVVRALVERGGELHVDGGPPLELAGVAVRDVDAAIARGLPIDLLTDAPAHLVADPSVDVVVELMGGDEPARTLIMAALGAGKRVVTANKHVVAHRGPEIEAISRRTGAAFRFEASVGGGIPVLGPLAAALAGSRVSRVRGIVNGTTNYILSAMAGEGRDYADALAAAQAAGYAEADPSGDVEGLDAANKLVILARLAFDAWLDPAAVRLTAEGPPGNGRPGITGVGAADTTAAAADREVVRLIAHAEARQDGIEASVLPTRVPADSAFGRTNGVTNRIEIDAEPLGSVAFEGPGAGGGATAVSVLGDVLAIARGEGSTWAGRPPARDLRAAPAGGRR